MASAHHRGVKPRGVFEGRKALDIAHSIYTRLVGKPGATLVVIVNGENEVHTQPDWSPIVERTEREHPERIAGYYCVSRNPRAQGITPASIRGDIMAVIGSKAA